MEISNKVPPLDKTPYVKQAAKPVEKPVVSHVAKADRVELSAQAKEIQAARKVVAGMDDVDLEKVARIKAQIEAGTYKVDAGKIADKMIDESLLDDLG
jgi:negative regulator of flagellin synthesis FlgM